MRKVTILNSVRALGQMMNCPIQRAGVENLIDKNSDIFHLHDVLQRLAFDLKQINTV